jgi:hypothetical protein
MRDSMEGSLGMRNCICRKWLLINSPDDRLILESLYYLVYRQLSMVNHILLADCLRWYEKSQRLLVSQSIVSLAIILHGGT